MSEKKETDLLAEKEVNKKKDAKSLIQELLEDKGKQSEKNVRKGEANVSVKLTSDSKVEVEFTKDYGKHIKKGHKQYLSQLAFEAYDKKGVVKKL